MSRIRLPEELLTPLQGFFLLMGATFFVSLFGPSSIGGYTRYPEAIHSGRLFPLAAALLMGILGVQIGETVANVNRPGMGRLARAVWGSALMCAALGLILPFLVTLGVWTGMPWTHLATAAALLLTVGVLWTVIAMWVVSWLASRAWRFEAKYLALAVGCFLPLPLAPALSPLLAVVAAWEGRTRGILSSWAAYAVVVLLSLGWWKWKDRTG